MSALEPTTTARWVPVAAVGSKFQNQNPAPALNSALLQVAAGHAVVMLRLGASEGNQCCWARAGFVTPAADGKGTHQAVQRAAALLLAVHVLAVQARQAAEAVEAGAGRAAAAVQPAPQCVANGVNGGAAL